MVQAVDSSVRKVVYEFLDELRESGTVNMFGASSDLQDEFGFDKSTCRSLLSDWMRDYEEKSWDEDELPERKY
tara:strand:+ start:208 stop:426 length:219 start_codon:yes stop_codon:yes gene_type:complete